MWLATLFYDVIPLSLGLWMATHSICPGRRNADMS